MPTPKNRGRVLRYRSVKRGGKTLICEVMEKAGPRGGKTVCHPRKKSTRSKSK